MVVAPSVVGTVYVVAGLGSLGFLRPALRNRDQPGSVGFVVVVTGIALWSVCNGANKFFGAFDVSVTLVKLVLLAAQLVGIGWFLLAVEYTDRVRITRRTLGGLGLVLALGQTLAWTNPGHHLVLGRGTRIVEGLLVTDYGPGFWTIVVVTYGLVAVGTGLLFVEWRESSGTRRRQAAVLTVGLLPPVLANAATITPLVSFQYDLTPLGFLGSAVVFVWALYGSRFLEIAPVARRTVVEEMDDAVITLDAEDAVVDYNAEAAALFDLDADAIGTTAARTFDVDEETVRRFEADDVETEISIADDDVERHFHLSISSLGDGSATREGRVVVLREITTLKRREQQLRERERELDLLRQVLTRILRHNLRNSMTVIRSCAELIRRKGPNGYRADPVATILDETDDLTAVSRKAKTIAGIVDERETTTFDLRSLVTDTAAVMRDRYPDVRIETDLRTERRVRANGGLGVAVENLVENAIEHNDTDRPTVRIRVEPADDGVSLVVIDDGPGIPQHELDVLASQAETALEHGSSVGLWLVEWVVDHSDATLSFETGDDGTTVTIRFDPSALVE